MVARTALVVQDASQAGTTQNAEQNSDVANGNSVVNTGQVVILARNSNGSATARYVDIQPSRTVAGQSVDAIRKTIAAGATAILGRYDRADFGSVIQINAEHADIKFQVIRA